MSLDQPDFDVKKQALIDLFLSNEIDESDEERDKAFEELSIQILKLQYVNTDISEEELAEVIKSFKEKMAAMECDDPRLAHSINGLNKIGNSKYGKASKYVEELLKSRQEEFSLAQTQKGNIPKRPDQLNLLLKTYLRIKPDLTTSEAIDRIRSATGNGVIIEVTEEEISYTNDPPHGEILHTAQIKGLRKRLNRLKNNT